ncbi:MAG: hypothetical protein M5U28_05320 [Sandaracinaceae bacterium]|nr:hypothetical protein [Sandaracinaceae bacterium]
MLPFAQFAPFEARAAFVIFPEADVSFPEQPPESANALLKTLEEPRPGVHFVLLSERPRSPAADHPLALPARALRRLPPSTLGASSPRTAWPRTRAPPPSRWPTGGPTARWRSRPAARRRCSSGPSRSTRWQRAAAPARSSARREELARGDELLAILDALVTFYRDVAAASLGLSDAALAFRHHAAAIRARAERLGAAAAADRVEAIDEARVALERNANPRSCSTPISTTPAPRAREPETSGTRA